MNYYKLNIYGNNLKATKSQIRLLNANNIIIRYKKIEKN